MTRCEHIIFHSTIDHLQRHNIIIINTKISSDQLILVKANYILTEEKLPITRNIDLLYVDFCKAFDKVPHKWFLNKIKVLIGLNND